MPLFCHFTYLSIRFNSRLVLNLCANKLEEHKLCNFSDSLFGNSFAHSQMRRELSRPPSLIWVGETFKDGDDNLGETAEEYQVMMKVSAKDKSRNVKGWLDKCLAEDTFHRDLPSNH